MNDEVSAITRAFVIVLVLLSITSLKYSSILNVFLEDDIICI
jgi:hypothetical protein